MPVDPQVLLLTGGHLGKGPSTLWEFGVVFFLGHLGILGVLVKLNPAHLMKVSNDMKPTEFMMFIDVYWN